MHQHPRPPPTTASPANSEQTNPTRTNNPRDRDIRHLRADSTQGSGSSEDFVNTKQESATDNPAAQMQRLNQVIQNFHTKAALIILHSRVELSEAISAKNNERRVNRWFNIELDETEEYNEEIRRWRKCDLKTDRPPPLIIEVYLTAETPGQGQKLVILDENEKRWDVESALEPKDAGRNKSRTTNAVEVLLERWTIELGEPSSSIPSDLTSILPLVYKKSIVLFRSLYTYCNFLPAYKLSRKVGRTRSNRAMKLGYRILDGSRMNQVSRSDNLETRLCESAADVTTTYTFGETDSPAGPFSVKVRYRENCEFRVDDSEELLSSRFLVADDDLSQASVPKGERAQNMEGSAKVGSLPNDRRQHLVQRPELGHAYGSMSTFHQAGFSAGTSPISTLRSARDLGQPQSSLDQSRQSPVPPPAQPRRGSLLGAAPIGRRTSFSFQPFKAPALSASPLGASPLGSSPRTSATRVPTLGSLTEESHLPPPNAPALAARRTGSLASDHTVPSSTSSSPKPTPVRYSSSFSHRRARLSSGGNTTKNEDDQASSGRASATSSTVPPGSGLMAEAAAGGSSGSMQEDDENISDFLKLLDFKRDLLVSSDTSSSDATTRKTASALNRFHHMRDSNANLSDSLSSSLIVPRSSSASSRQTSGVPAMIAPNSTSTASSPGKPVSPHTPHTPFAPSRLSAAYSHDDPDLHQHLSVEEEQSPDATTISVDPAQARSSANVPAIDIPSSPRPFLSAGRRSSSAQRGPIPSDDDLGDIFGMRSASMGAHETKTNKPQAAKAATDDTVVPPGTRKQRPDMSPQRSSGTHRQAELIATANDGASDSGSGRSSAHVYRSRVGRGGTLRSGTNVTPPQGSTSSFGGTTGGSLERTGDSGGSASGSWARGGRFRSGSRPDTRFADDEDFLFAMEKSDFTADVAGKDGRASGR